MPHAAREHHTQTPENMSSSLSSLQASYINDLIYSFIIIVVNAHLIRILPDLGMYRFFNRLTASTRNLQDEIVERRAAEDVYMVGCITRQHCAQMYIGGIDFSDLPVFGPPRGLKRSGSCFISYVVTFTPAGL